MQWCNILHIAMISFYLFNQQGQGALKHAISQVQFTQHCKVVKHSLHGSFGRCLLISGNVPSYGAADAQVSRKMMREMRVPKEASSSFAILLHSILVLSMRGFKFTWHEVTLMQFYTPSAVHILAFSTYMSLFACELFIRLLCVRLCDISYFCEQHISLMFCNFVWEERDWEMEQVCKKWH